ncbi:hypothetical protein Dda_8580 [Drechslerella dactyloides]|uniref:Uncharacterized protein n=1 Tax=Drechslerella dactyloides TaxID=74499 RepID=A0AAD6IRR7_DREDA|nr:hypothetical protein Dda_8580 [Drechslerella dactyloides]
MPARKRDEVDRIAGGRRGAAFNVNNPPSREKFPVCPAAGSTTPATHFEISPTSGLNLSFKHHDIHFSLHPPLPSTAASTTMAAALSSSSAFVCRSCSRHLRPLVPLRSFSSTPSPADSPSTDVSTDASTVSPATISPYSPHYVDIPFPPQRYPAWQPRPKGKRPIPRKIFRPNTPKTTPEYLANLSKEPSRASQPSEDTPATQKSYISWKARMAESRRRNIRDGLLELHAQTAQRESHVARRSRAKQELRAALLAQDDPEIATLTTPSVLSALHTKHKLEDPDRAERLAASRQRYIAAEESKIVERRNELHELYIRSHDFIVSESQLDEAIHNQFSATATAETSVVMPPDTRDILQRMANEELVTGYYHEEVILKTMRDALTGGSMRSARLASDETKRTADRFGVLQPGPMSSFGYAGQQTAKSTENPAAVDFLSVLKNNNTTK